MGTKLAIRSLLGLAFAGFFMPWAIIHIGESASRPTTGLTFLARELPKISSGALSSVEIILLVFVMVIFFVIIASFLSTLSEQPRSRKWISFTFLVVSSAAVICPIILYLATSKSSSVHEVRTTIGYGVFIVAFGLVGSSAFYFMDLQHDARTGRKSLVRPDDKISANHANHQDDIAFWDTMKSKHDNDLLEEYLVRFPHGTFSELAMKRLDR
jgi:hypothetical protein